MVKACSGEDATLQTRTKISIERRAARLINDTNVCLLFHGKKKNFETINSLSTVSGWIGKLGEGNIEG